MNPSPGTPTATNEELLRKVIEAQVRGGFTSFSSIRNCNVGTDGYVENEIAILHILLDTEGCKAAYPSPEYTIETGDKRKDILLNMVADHMREKGHLATYSEYVSLLIVSAWNEGEGNNLRAALETAVSLLPS